MCFLNKNYLKRTDFIDLMDIDKIHNKKMSIKEIKNMLNTIEEELAKHQFDTDKNYIFNSRRKATKSEMKGFLVKSDNTNEFLYYALHSFWEFVSDEYPGNIMSDCRELGISIKEFDAMDKAYRKKGIICAQEKDTMLEMIRELKKHLNKEKNNDNTFSKIEFLKANYESPEQWAENTIKAYSFHEPIKEEYLEKLKKCKTWDDVLILLDEVVPFLTR